jgi:hypothetical protein
MTTIVWPTSFDTEVVDAIRTAIGRVVYFYVPNSGIPCTNSGCSLDPVTNQSTNSYCTVCSGEYWIVTYQSIPVTGHITWGMSELLGWQTGGTFSEGDCRVQIKYLPSLETVVDNAKWVEVDNRRLQVVKKIIRGVQTVNRILVDLEEWDNDRT